VGVKKRECDAAGTSCRRNYIKGVFEGVYLPDSVKAIVSRV